MDNKFDEKLENFLNEIDIYNNDRSGKEFIENYHKNKNIFDEDNFYDLMEMAQNANSETEALKYVNKVLKLESNNVDVLILKAQIKANSNIDLLKKLKKF